MPVYLPMQGPSGINTQDVIKKLVTLEKAPQKRLEKEKGDLNVEVQYLEETRKLTKKLQKSLKLLYSFENSFEAKSFEVSPEGFLSGIANKKATPEKHAIEILNLAQRLKINSRKVKNSEKIKSGKIIINGKKTKYSGGKLDKLRDFLNKKYSKSLSSSIVKVNSLEKVLVLESKTVGRGGYLDFTGSEALLNNLKIIQEDSGSNKANSNLKNKNLDFTNLKLSNNKNIIISQNKKKINFNDVASASKVIIALKDEKIKSLSFNYIPPKGAHDNAPATINVGPIEKINIKGIELESYNLERQRKKDTSSEKDFGIILKQKNEDGSIKENKISLKTKKTNLQNKKVELTQWPKSIIFYSDGAKIQFSDLKIQLESKEKSKDKENDETNKFSGLTEKEFLEMQKRIFPHLIEASKDANLKVDGIQVSRKKNENIDDLIEGVSLTLLKKSEDAINAEVKKNISDSKKQILNFVKAYNDLQGFIIYSSKSGDVDKDGKFKEKKEKGILANNASLRNLLSSLRMKISDAYPSVREPNIRMLATIGISTGAIGSKWTEIKSGELVVDEEKLTEHLKNYPRAVKELFVIDSDGNNKPDNGFALMTERFLRPYTTTTRGIISSQIKNRKERFKRINEKIAKLEEKSKGYEAKLRQKFGFMEGSVGKQKAIGNMLKNRMRPNN